jgi:hypothetical protein
MRELVFSYSFFARPAQAPRRTSEAGRRVGAKEEKGGERRRKEEKGGEGR